MVVLRTEATTHRVRGPPLVEQIVLDGNAPHHRKLTEVYQSRAECIRGIRNRSSMEPCIQSLQKRNDRRAAVDGGSLDSGAIRSFAKIWTSTGQRKARPSLSLQSKREDPLELKQPRKWVQPQFDSVSGSTDPPLGTRDLSGSFLEADHCFSRRTVIGCIAAP